MSNPSRLDYRSLGVAILIPFIAAGVQWLLWTHLEPLIFLLFYPAVFFSAWIGGRLGGIIATLLSAALVVYFFVPPIFTFYSNESNVLYSVAIFIGMGCLFSYVFHAWKQTNRRFDLMAQLQASEARYSELVQHANSVIIRWRIDGTITFVNEYAQNLFGYRADELIGRDVRILTPARKSTGGDLTTLVQDIAAHPERFKQNINENICRDGRRVWVAWTNTPVCNAAGQVTEILAMGADITDRKQAEQRVHYLTRTYATLSQVNQTIVRTTDRQELFDVICQIAIDYGEFKLAWIGLFDAVSGQVTPVARHELGDVQLPIEHLNLNEEPFRSGLIGRALLGDRVAVANDVFSDQGMTHWYDFARQHNYQSIAAIPIHQQGQLVGVLNLYAADVDFFVAEEEQKLLAEMGLDISFALDTMQSEAQRRQTLAALRGSEARSRALIENAPDGIVLVTPTEFKYASPSALKLFGYQQAMLFQHGPADLTHPDDLPQVLAALTDLLQNPAHVPTVQYRFRHQTGSWRWIESTFSNLLAEPGVEAIVINFRDITERKQAEERLAESEERLSLVLEGSQLGYWDWNIETGVVRRNEYWAAMLGYTLSEVETNVKQWTDLHHPDDRAVAWQSIQDHLVGRTPAHRIEYRMRCKNGEYKWILDQARVVKRDAQGRPVRMSGTHTDITVRKQAETALLESIARFQTLFEASPDAIVLIEPQEKWTILECNSAACEMNGYAREELIGQSIDLLNLTPGDPTERQEYIEQIRRAGILRTESCHRRKDGSIFPIDISTTIITLGGREVVLGIDRDITERKQAEAALQQSEARYQQFIAQSFEAIYRTEFDQPVDTSLPVDEQIDLIYQYAYMAECNQAMAAMYHLSSAADMIGTRLVDAHGGKDNPVNRAAFRKFIEADYKSMDDETMEYTADRKPVWFLSNTVGTVENGQLVRLWGTSLDITARKQTEAALRDSEKKYRDLLNGMNDTICVIDSDTTILDVNNAATLVLGYTRDELLSMTISDIDAELTTEQIQGLASSMPHDKLQIFETWHRTKDGRRLPVEVSSSLVSYLGRTVIMSIARDITERKRAEIELQRLNTELELRVAQRTAQLAAANDRLLDLDRLKSKFVSDVSHELRTPVTSLSLYIDLLEHGKPEKRELYVGKLKEQMARLRTLINDILDLSRLERDRDEGGRSPVDINAIVEHVTATQLIAAETAGLVLTSDVGDNLPAVVARPDQLTRAITNLIANAIKYTPRGTVHVRTYQCDERVCVEVADTGLGIPADELPHLFDRFYRGRAVAQSNIPGSGLGLSIVKEIIESHGGRAEVESELGRGSTFFIWLPIA